jgi:hypothetical protein
MSNRDTRESGLAREEAALPENRLRGLDLLAQWEVVLCEPGCPGLTSNGKRPEDWDEMQNAGD